MLKDAFRIVMIASVAVIGFLGLALYRSCRDIAGLVKDNSALAESESRLKDEILIRDKERDSMIEAYEKKIAELDGMIDSSNTVIAGYEGQDAALAEAQAKLRRAESQAKTSEELVSNIREQLRVGEGRFTLCLATVAEKDKIIFSLTDKYEIARKEIDLKDAQVADYRRLQAASDARAQGLEKLVRRQALQVKVVTWVGVGLAAYIVVDIVKELFVH